METDIGTRGTRRRGGAAERMKGLARLLLAAGLSACQPAAPPGAAPAAAARGAALPLVEPAVFAGWPRVTERPVPVGSGLYLLCVPATEKQNAELRASAARHGPHDRYAIVVRVSPDGEAAFRAGRTLPPGAVVVKEKHDRMTPGQLQAYAVMTKREAGFDPAGGDWEYAFVALAPQRVATRDGLEGCAGCHASARRTDYLFREYGESRR